MSRTALLFLACLAPGAARGSDVYSFFHENVMGTALRLDVRASDEAGARRAEAAALAAVDRLTKVFSAYDPASEFRRWRDGGRGPVKVSAELFEVLALSDRWRDATGGAFDPRADVYSRLWAAAAAGGKVPDADETEGARAFAARPAWRLDAGAGTAERLSDVPVTLDGIAKGYIVEKACDAALAAGPGVAGVLLNVGGDLRAAGEAAEIVGVAPPRGDSESTEPLTKIAVKGRAVATSGDSRRGFLIDGRLYSHIFDPRTGRPADGAASASVVAPRSADADALATALNVLSPEEGVRLAAALPGVDALVVKADGRKWQTTGWEGLERAAVALLAPQKPAAQAKGKAAEVPPPSGWWGLDHEVLIDFEIQAPEGNAGRYRRPYVAVWVEDSEGFPVRNVLLWVSFGGAGPYQWLPDLKRWSRADSLRRKVDKMNVVDAIGRPTRKPGKYEAVWDGKDDHGAYMPAGDYTVCLDIAREHGTYQSLRQAVTVGGSAMSKALPGNVELKSAAVSYRAKQAAASK